MEFRSAESRQNVEQENFLKQGHPVGRNPLWDATEVLTEARGPTRPDLSHWNPDGNRDLLFEYLSGSSRVREKRRYLAALGVFYEPLAAVDLV